MYETLERTETILKAVITFLEENPVKDYMVTYDEARCDGYCLQDDAQLLLDQIQREMEALKGETVNG